MPRMPSSLPATQHAVQLVGPGQLRLNTAKPVPVPGPHQLLVRVEATGLCFSDLKLLKQFSSHPRKGPILEGLSQEVLAQIPGYVPGEQPTVLGHEAVGRIVAIGPKMAHHALGERVMVQADYRRLRTAGANAAFGYNFEGALQEYALFDERVVVEADTGERYLIPVGDGLSASAVALVEPWACVENSYATAERQTIKPGGRLLVVAEAGREVAGLAGSLSPGGGPAAVTAIAAEPNQLRAVKALGIPVTTARNADDLADESFDDIVYFGSSKDGVDAFNGKLAAGGIFNIVLAGRSIGMPASVGVGRLHYGQARWVGTVAASAVESYKTIPANGELRAGDRVCVVGAGGPMGQMHTIRAICAAAPGVSVVATDLDGARLESLRRKAEPLARRHGVPLCLVNTTKQPLAGEFTYFALMAPMGELVAHAIAHSAPGALINIFAGIPAPTRHDLDMDVYIRNRCFMFGTSGSRIEDMKTVLAKVAAGRLDTNASVDAVCGLAGAIDGMAAVENRTMAGKIVVYPELRELGLVPLSELHKRYPTVAAKLQHGMWTAEAERELLAAAALLSEEQRG